MDVQRSTSIMLLALVAGFAAAADTDDASYLGPPAFDAPQESDIAVELKIGPELQTAKGLYQQAKWKEVVDQLTDLILLESQGPGAVDALFLRAEARVQLEEYAEALSDYQQLLTRKASQVQFTHAQFRVAELNHLLGHFDDAIAHLEKFRRREPKHQLNAYVLPYLAESYEKTGKRDEARRIYVEALRKFPDGPKHIQCRLQIAILDYHRKRYESSRKLLDEVVTKTKAPSSYYWNASFWLAMIEFNAEEWGAAAGRFARLIEAKPIESVVAPSLYYGAKSFENSGQPRLALPLYQELQRDWPASSFASLSKLASARAAYRANDFELALTLAQPAARSDDASVLLDALALQAQVRLSQERHTDVLKLLLPVMRDTSPTSSLEIRNLRAKLSVLLAVAHRGLDDFDSALRTLRSVELRTVDARIAEQVLLTGIETLNLQLKFDKAAEQSYRYQREFPNGIFETAVRAQLVRALVGTNRREAAKVEFRQLQDSDPSASESIFAARHFGEMSYAEQDYADAREVFAVLEKVSTEPNDRIQAISGLAWSELKLNNREAAAKWFAEFLQNYADHSTADRVRLAHAQNLIHLGRLTEAVPALRYFRKLDRDTVGRSHALYVLADQLHRHHKHLAEAQDLVEIVLTDYPQFERRHAALYLLGVVRRARGNEQASDAFQELVEQYPDSEFWADAVYRLAEESHRNKEHSEAKRYLTRLISTTHDAKVLPHALYMKGRLESSEQEWDLARKTLRRLLREYPNSSLLPLARYGVAETFYQQGELERAAQLFEILNEENEYSASDTWGAMLQLRRAQLLSEHDDDPVTALEVATKIEQYFPDFPLQPQVDYFIGKTYASRGEFSRARKYYERVIAAEPLDDRELAVMAEWMTGETYFHQKEYVKAAKIYQAVLKEDAYPHWQASSYLQIGKCFELLKRLELANKAYSALVKRYPNSSSADEARYRLEQIQN